MTKKELYNRFKKTLLDGREVAFVMVMFAIGLNGYAYEEKRSK